MALIHAGCGACPGAGPERLIELVALFAKTADMITEDAGFGVQGAMSATQAPLRASAFVGSQPG